MKKNKLILKGIGASGGRVKGRVLRIENPAKPVTPKSGYIIVSSFTTPVISLALSVAGGIICEKGGLTSHGAIVAREFNIPCLVGAKDALKLLRDNQLIILDADKGNVYEA